MHSSLISPVVFVAVVMTSPALADDTLSPIEAAIAANQYAIALDSINEQLATDPTNTELIFQRARVMNFSGRHTEALVDINSLCEQYAGNVDYLLLRAQILVRQGLDNEALGDLRHAAQLAPQYEDVWRLRYSLLMRGDANDAGEEINVIRNAAAARFPDATWWRPPQVVARRTLLFGASHDSLDNQSSDWNGQFAEYHWDHSEYGLYRLRVARDQRFAGADVTIGVAGDYRWSSEWTTGLELGGVHDAKFQPGYSVGAHVGRTLPDGWAVDLRYRYRDYGTATVGSLIGTVEKYSGDFRLAYGLGWSHLYGATNSVSHVLTGNWYFSERTSAGLSLASGREAEAVGIGQVLETDIRSLSINGRHQLNDRLGLQWWLGVHDQGDLYRRSYLGMAVSIRL